MWFMTLLVRVGVALTILLQVSLLTVHPQNQQPAPLVGARLDHIALAAQDADRAATELADILGTQTTAARLLASEAPDGSPVRLKTAILNTTDFTIEVSEPISGASPTREFLERFGLGIEHIGFSVSDKLSDRVHDMEQRGGVVTLRQSAPDSAIVVFPNIGLSIELTQADAPSGSVAPTWSSDALADRRVSHVGFVYRDAQPALSLMAALLGVQTPSLTTFKPIDYRPGDPSDPAAHVKFAAFRAGDVSLEVIEPVGGPSPWMDFVTDHRAEGGAHHLAFSFGAEDQDFDASVRHLEAKGGQWRKGTRGIAGETSGSSPEFEFLDTLGLVVEVTKAGA